MAGCQLPGNARLALRYRRIGSCLSRRARRVAPGSRLFQARFGTATKRQLLFLAVDPIFRPPQFRPAGCDQQIKPSIIGTLAVDIADFGQFDRGICQRHRVTLAIEPQNRLEKGHQKIALAGEHKRTLQKRKPI